MTKKGRRTKLRRKAGSRRRRAGTSNRTRRAPVRRLTYSESRKRRRVAKAESARKLRGTAKMLAAFVTRPRVRSRLRYEAVVKKIAAVERASGIADIVRAQKVSSRKAAGLFDEMLRVEGRTLRQVAVDLYRQGVRAPGGLKELRYRSVFELPKRLADETMTRRYSGRWKGRGRKRRFVYWDKVRREEVSGPVKERRERAVRREAEYKALALMLGADRATVAALVRDVYGGDMRSALLDVAYQTLSTDVAEAETAEVYIGARTWAQARRRFAKLKKGLKLRAAKRTRKKQRRVR